MTDYIVYGVLFGKGMEWNDMDNVIRPIGVYVKKITLKRMDDLVVDGKNNANAIVKKYLENGFKDRLYGATIPIDGKSHYCVNFLFRFYFSNWEECFDKAYPYFLVSVTKVKENMQYEVLKNSFVKANLDAIREFLGFLIDCHCDEIEISEDFENES